MVLKHSHKTSCRRDCLEDAQAFNKCDASFTGTEGQKVYLRVGAVYHDPDTQICHMKYIGTTDPSVGKCAVSLEFTR
jgi:hypothetical protein